MSENQDQKIEPKINSSLASVGNKALEIISKKDRIEIWIKIITLLFTVVAVIITFLTYQASQKWKIAEFMSSKISEYSQNKSVKIVNQFLDYNACRIEIDSSKYIVITDKVLYEALVIDKKRADFSKIELKIRNIFDEYFNKQAEFNRYIESGVFESDKLKPFLDYQISIIADTTHSPHNDKKSIKLKHRIWDYINYYGFTDVNKLYKKLGYNIDRTIN
jgi:hypothetical protein